VTDKIVERVTLLAALMVFGFALVPVAFGDKGGNPHGGSGGVNPTTTATTDPGSTTSATPSTATATTTPTTTTTTTGGGNGKHGGGSGAGPSSTALALVSEWIQGSPNPAAPDWCLNEDDFDQRTLSGSLNGSFATTYRLCDVSTDYSGGIWWSAGGLGLETEVAVVGALSDLTITAPDGTTHHAVATGASTSNGQTTYTYATCYVPPYAISTDQGTDPLSGGTWSITLSGQISQASWITRVQMADVAFQDSYCPVSEQNLTP
jgi:hypothetical protein